MSYCLGSFRRGKILMKLDNDIASSAEVSGQKPALPIDVPRC